MRNGCEQRQEGTPGMSDDHPFAVDAEGCVPLENAVFEIWHADAAGEYSGFDGSAAPGADTTASRYLRGAQTTDGDGIAEILTIYPGWYPGRTPHIHAKVFVSNNEVLTTQLYFEDAVSTAVYAQAPSTRAPAPVPSSASACRRPISASGLFVTSTACRIDREMPPKGSRELRKNLRSPLGSLWCIPSLRPCQGSLGGAW